MPKRLTREMLDNWGITINWDKENNCWNVTRLWFKNKSKEKILYKMKEYIFTCKHKYTQDKQYPGYSFSIGKSKPFAVTTGRLIWAYHYGEVPENMDVDHINNNCFDNRLENLQLLTREENIKKRFNDNPQGCWNQHQAIKKYHKE